MRLRVLAALIVALAFGGLAHGQTETDFGDGPGVPIPVASLPTCDASLAAQPWAVRHVNDSNGASICAGGGGDVTIALCDGTQWRCLPPTPGAGSGTDVQVNGGGILPGADLQDSNGVAFSESGGGVTARAQELDADGDGNPEVANNLGLLQEIDVNSDGTADMVIDLSGVMAGLCVSLGDNSAVSGPNLCENGGSVFLDLDGDRLQGSTERSIGFLPGLPLSCVVAQLGTDACPANAWQRAYVTDSDNCTNTGGSGANCWYNPGTASWELVSSGVGGGNDVLIQSVLRTPIDIIDSNEIDVTLDGSDNVSMTVKQGSIGAGRLTWNITQSVGALVAIDPVQVGRFVPIAGAWGAMVAFGQNGIEVYGAGTAAECWKSGGPGADPFWGSCGTGSAMQENANLLTPATDPLTDRIGLGCTDIGDPDSCTTLVGPAEIRAPSFDVPAGPSGTFWQAREPSGFGGDWVRFKVKDEDAFPNGPVLHEIGAAQGGRLPWTGLEGGDPCAGLTATQCRAWFDADGDGDTCDELMEFANALWFSNFATTPLVDVPLAELGTSSGVYRGDITAEAMHREGGITCADPGSARSVTDADGDGIFESGDLATPTNVDALDTGIASGTSVTFVTPEEAILVLDDLASGRAVMRIEEGNLLCLGGPDDGTGGLGGANCTGDGDCGGNGICVPENYVEVSTTGGRCGDYCMGGDFDRVDCSADANICLPGGGTCEVLHRGFTPIADDGRAACALFTSVLETSGSDGRLDTISTVFQTDQSGNVFISYPWGSTMTADYSDGTVDVAVSPAAVSPLECSGDEVNGNPISQEREVIVAAPPGTRTLPCTSTARICPSEPSGVPTGQNVSTCDGSLNGGEDYPRLVVRTNDATLDFSPDLGASSGEFPGIHIGDARNDTTTGEPDLNAPIDLDLRVTSQVESDAIENPTDVPAVLMLDGTTGPVKVSARDSGNLSFKRITWVVAASFKRSVLDFTNEGGAGGMVLLEGKLTGSQVRGQFGETALAMGDTPPLGNLKWANFGANACRWGQADDYCQGLSKLGPIFRTGSSTFAVLEWGPTVAELYCNGCTDPLVEIQIPIDMVGSVLTQEGTFKITGNTTGDGPRYHCSNTTQTVVQGPGRIEFDGFAEGEVARADCNGIAGGYDLSEFEIVVGPTAGVRGEQAGPMYSTDVVNGNYTEMMVIRDQLAEEHVFWIDDGATITTDECLRIRSDHAGPSSPQLDCADAGNAYLVDLVAKERSYLGAVKFEALDPAPGVTCIVEVQVNDAAAGGGTFETIAQVVYGSAELDDPSDPPVVRMYGDDIAAGDIINVKIREQSGSSCGSTGGLRVTVPLARH